MTGTNSKRAAAIAATGMIALLSSVLPVFAQMRGDAQLDVRVRAEGSVNACERLTQMADRLQARLGELRTVLDQRRDERKKSIADRRDERKEKTAERRGDWEERWDKIVLDLEAKAETDAQKAAILQFKMEMRAALDARKAAVDAANVVFRAGIDKAVTDRKTAVQAAADALKAAVKAAFDKAKADCASGVAAATVTANLKASLEAAHAKFRTDMQAIEKVGTNARALTETRRIAVEKAHTAFKAAAQKARDTLKAKLKADATAPAMAPQQ